MKTAGYSGTPLLYVHRVNTDLPAAEFKSVNSNEIGELLKRILSSKELGNRSLIGKESALKSRTCHS